MTKDQRELVLPLPQKTKIVIHLCNGDMLKMDTPVPFEELKEGINTFWANPNPGVYVLQDEAGLTAVPRASINYIQLVRSEK